MKTVLNILLVAAAVALVVMCYQSLMIPIDFNNQVAKRNEVVIQKMKDIRTLQEKYHTKYGVYAASWDQLTNFVENDSIAIVEKLGSLTDAQLEKGLTEDKAVKYLSDPKKYAKELKEFELSKATFSRDSTYVPVLMTDSVLNTRPAQYFDTLRYNPFLRVSDNDTIELNTGSLLSASGFTMPLFEAKLPFRSYLNDLNKQELQNIIADRELMDKFPGMQVGDAVQANNNAGNWE